MDCIKNNKGIYISVINIGYCEQCKIHCECTLNKNYQATHVLHTLLMLNISKEKASVKEPVQEIIGMVQETRSKIIGSC